MDLMNMSRQTFLDNGVEIQRVCARITPKNEKWFQSYKNKGFENPEEKLFYANL